MRQLHPCLLRCPARFAMVAGDTGADQVLPGVLSTQVPRNDVVQGKLAGLFAAVLAGKLVTVKNLKTCQLGLQTGSPDHMGEPDYGGQREHIASGMNIAYAIFQHLRLTVIDERDGTACPANIKWLIALVQYQHGIVYHLTHILIANHFIMQALRFNGIKTLLTGVAK